MSETEPHVFAAVQVLSARLIDHGNTVAVRLQRADGGEEIILLQLATGRDLSAQLAACLAGDVAGAAAG